MLWTVPTSPSLSSHPAPSSPYSMPSFLLTLCHFIYYLQLHITDSQPFMVKHQTCDVNHTTVFKTVCKT